MMNEPTAQSNAQESPPKQLDKTTQNASLANDLTIEHSASGLDDATVEHTSVDGHTIDESTPATVVSGAGAVHDDATLPNVSAGHQTQGDRRRPSHEDYIGQQVGPYHIVSLLGRGGMGVVYLARHKRLQRDVAIKMILGAALRDGQSLDRFDVEARTIANLQHPNVVQLYEFGHVEHSPYFALEYIKGGTLADRLKENPLPAQEAARIVEKLARAMQVAHEQGIIHRDLKPANILMTVEGEPKVSDFGLAKDLVSQDDHETKTGTVMGTPSFMSPEQARGQIGELGGETDQYSLGAILYACLSGRPPFMSASTIDTISQVVHKEPIPPRQLAAHVPSDLETICLKTLQKDPARRYASCGELADDLQSFLTGKPIKARPVGAAERTLRWCKRNPTIAIPSALAGLFLFAAAGISMWAWAATSAQAAIIAQERDNVKSERDEAEKQRDEARRQRTIAEQQQVVAEDNERLAQKQADLALKNIQYVITDIDAKLREQPGMDELRIGVLDSMSQRWNELDVGLTGGLRGEAIPTLMAVRQLMANAFVELDRLPLANKEFEKLEEMARERIAIMGRVDATRYNLARVLFTKAPLARRLKSDPSEGIEQFKEALEMLDEIERDPQPKEGSPTPLDLLRLRAAIAQNLGVELLRDGLLSETELYFSESLASNEKAMAFITGAEGFSELNEDQRDTQTASLQIQIDKARVGLAYIKLRLGKTEEALPSYEEAIASRREIFNRRQNMLIMKTELAGYLKIYGKSLMWLDRAEDALAPMRESVQLSEEAWQTDPAKASLKRAFAESLYLFGNLKESLNLPNEAVALHERSRLVWSELVDDSPDEKNRISLMLAESAVGNVEATQELANAMSQGAETNAELHLERARALARLSTFVDGEQRDELVNDALEALQRSVTEGFSDPFRLRVEPELASIRNHPRYLEILSKLQ